MAKISIADIRKMKDGMKAAKQQLRRTIEDHVEDEFLGEGAAAYNGAVANVAKVATLFTQDEPEEKKPAEAPEKADDGK